MVGTGAALAGIGGVAVAAITANPPVEKTVVKTVAQPVETRTVVIRKVEHRVKRVKPKHHRVAQAAQATPAPVVQAPAPVVQAPAPVVQATPVTTPAPAPHPIRTRTSGSHSGSGENESHGGDDGAEHGDD